MIKNAAISLLCAMAAIQGDNTPWTSGKIWSAVIAGGIPLLVSLILGAICRPGSWYRGLRKPCFTPPGWLFAVAWIILYPFLGVGMIAACYNTDKPASYILPIINIVVSLLFSIVMFGFHSILWGMLVTLASFGMGIGLIAQYSALNHSSLAWGLTIPYAVWTGFASVLAMYIYLYNSCKPKKRVKRDDSWLCYP